MAMPLNPRLQLSSPTESIRYSEFIAPGVCYPQSKRSVCEPGTLNAPRTIVSPRLPFTMPTHQLIPPTRCTRSHERLRNEPNFTSRSHNTPANVIYETKPIQSDRHRHPLTLHTRQHENTRRTQFRPQPIANKTHLRSEERRVGKECRSRWSP